MRLGALIRSDLARSKRRLLVVVSAVASGITVLVLLASIALGLYEGVVEPLLPRLPLDVLEVKPRTVGVGFLAFEGGGKLDAAAVKSLERIEGVEAVHGVLGAAFPMRAEGGEGFIGHRMRTDVFATGLPPTLVAGDVAEGYTFEDEAQGKVPVLVARRLLDLYNTTVAPSIEKPRLTEEAVVGFEFLLVLGQSYASGTPNPAKVVRRTAQIVGFSDRANLVGITVPASTLERWNQQIAAKPSPVTGAYVKTSGPGHVGAVTKAIERAGLAVDDTPKIIGAALAVIGALGGLFAGALLLLSAFGIAQTFFLLIAERRQELAILRAVGARRRDLSRLVWIEATLVGVAGGLVGVVLGAALALGLDAIIIATLPDIPFKPAHVVALSPTLLLSAALLGPVAAWLGAAVPAASAARANPASALRSA
ncbi:MAG: ABC transporter permease [Deltaproteobacteria bacterium]